jgi:AraC-like DNA-binding protein
MSSCLDHITDWAALAKSGHYSAAKLASACGVTPRQLERYFQARYGSAPHHWLRALRMRLAVELIRDQTPLKVVAIDLHYKNPAHFAHDFKAYFGVCPSCFSRKKDAGKQVDTPHESKQARDKMVPELLATKPRFSGLAAG